MKKIENIMLKKYYPKLIVKSKLGLIKRDHSIKKNFDLIFSENKYYLNNRNIFTSNKFFDSVQLFFFMIKNLK